MTIVLNGLCILAGFLQPWTLAAARADWSEHAFDGRRASDDMRTPERESAPPTGSGAEVETRIWVVVRAADPTERTRILEAGVSIEEVWDRTVGGIATPEALQRLRKAGFEVVKQMRLGQFFPEGFPQPDEAYHDYPEVLSELSAVAQGNKGLVSLVAVGASLQGRKILGVRFNTSASGDQPSDKPGIVFLGTHHAREHLSTETPLLLAKWLAANRDRADVKKLLETRDVYLIPLVNPDGSEYDIATGRYRYHRKNMRPNADGSAGVDLNRNYGWHWSEGGSSPDPRSDVYHGPSAFSEPESRAVRDFIEARPNLRVLLSYHTFSELILYPWGHSRDPIEDGPALKAYKAMAEKMARWTGYIPEQSSDLYIASGDTTDWSWGAKKIFSFTFELTPKSMRGGGFYPGVGAIDSTLQKNIEPALYLIDLADDPYRAASEPVAARPAIRPIEALAEGSK